MYKYLIISALILFGFLNSQNNEDDSIKKKTDSKPSKSLREIVAKNYPEGNVYIGSASMFRAWGTKTEKILNQEFAYVTPTNDFKQSYIHPKPGVWQWERSDTWVRKCMQNNQIMRIHGPISPQCSRWVKNDARKPAELKKILYEYMTELCNRYNKFEHIKWMDVVNETVTRKGDWFGPKQGDTLWENPWPQIGFDTDSLKTPLYIKYAFEIANKYAPDIKLVINQHGTVDDIIWDKIKYLVSYLRNQGLRVDGIGWQAHVDLGWEKEEGNLQKLGKLIDWAHANQLDFHITENNVWLKKGNKDKWDEQSETFAAIMKVLISKHKTGVVTWNLWNIRDNETAHPEWQGSLYFNNYKPKPAFFAIKKVLENPAD